MAQAASSRKAAAASTDPDKAAEDGDKISDVVQAKVDKENEKGYRGANTDPTPNHAYTVAGVAAGEPTPETDEELAAQTGSTKFRDRSGTFED